MWNRQIYECEKAAGVLAHWEVGFELWLMWLLCSTDPVHLCWWRQTESQAKYWWGTEFVLDYSCIDLWMIPVQYSARIDVGTKQQITLQILICVCFVKSCWCICSSKWSLWVESSISCEIYYRNTLSQYAVLRGRWSQMWDLVRKCLLIKTSEIKKSSAGCWQGLLAVRITIHYDAVYIAIILRYSTYCSSLKMWKRSWNASCCVRSR